MFNDDREREIDNLEDLKKIFPGLREYDLGEGRLEKVNRFEAEEISVYLGKIKYKNKKGKNNDVVKTFLNLWYSDKNVTIPLIVEFTYDYSAISKVKNLKNRIRTSMEQFPLPLVRNTYEFYSSFQDSRIVDLKSSKTKTEFAYQYKP